MKRNNYIILFCILTTVLWSCETTFDDPNYSSGTANFTSYVSVGNSLTAGVQDGALYADGQLSSFPAQLAQQFAKTNGGAFKQPLLTGTNGMLGVSPAPSMANPLQTLPKRVLSIAVDCLGEAGLSPVLAATPNPANVDFYTTLIGSQGPFNNMGIPGIKSWDLTRESLGDPLMPTLANPFYTRIASVPGTSTAIDDALLVSPTFFTLWIGNNDVLGYATSGGAGKVDGLSPNDITSVATFEAAIDAVLLKLTANGAKGVILNIPNVTSIPYFTTIPYNGLELSATEAAGLTAAYAGTGISFSEGANAFIIEDTTTVLGFRKIKEGEFLLLTLPQDSIKCAGWGSSTPIPMEFVLDESEIMNISSYTSAYNSKLRSVANANGLAFADMNSYFKTFETGFVFNGVDYSTEFVSGGGFSLDGVHPSMRGYGIIANEVIRVINSKYNSTLPLIDVNDLPGIVFP
ncbi:MAG: hypothetical protein HKN22_03470 [Bacteroidia bacterium]|nr:hypothetical protein [Bacteroidia bacterium]